MSNESALRVELYEPKYESSWNLFIDQSNNGVFLFNRGYLEYHADRFRDFSLLFFERDKLVALMPANRVDDTVVSHGGLTFGGIVSDQRMTTSLMLEVFSTLIRELRARGVKQLVYKAVPHIYHRLPAEEDLRALFVNGAKLCRRDVSSTIVPARRPPVARLRRRCLERAKSQGVEVSRSHDFAGFMAIAEANLAARYGVRPVHSQQEIQLLAERFPENIKLFAAHLQGELLGGYLIYESANVAHAQYGHASEKGRNLGALDRLIDVLLNEVYPLKPYFDFGISTLDGGRQLNTNLIRNKEGYGGRATVYDFYELCLLT